MEKSGDKDEQINGKEGNKLHYLFGWASLYHFSPPLYPTGVLESNRGKVIMQ